MTRTRALPRVSGVAAAALCLTLAACGTEAAPEDPADPTGTTTASPAAPTTDEDDMTSSGPKDPAPTSLPPSATGDLPLGEVPAEVQEREDVQAAVAAEAKRTGVSADEVKVAGYADVTWRDGSIGCPMPGMAYTQALVPGHQLVLEVDGELASYHAAKGKDFSYCANPQSPAPGSADS